MCKAKYDILIIIFDIVYVAKEANNVGFKLEQDKKMLSLVHGWKIKTLSLKSMFLVLIKKSVIKYLTKHNALMSDCSLVLAFLNLLQVETQRFDKSNSGTIKLYE